MRVTSLLFHDVYVSDPAESGFSSETANRYKLALADFEAQLAGVATVRADAPMLAGDLVGGSAARNPPFLITVDDGGVSYHTHIADRLEARGWRGHCFVSTDFIGRRGFLDPGQIRELDARGHVIGSHSASHPVRFSACTLGEMAAEWSRSRQVLEDVLGHGVDVASVPGGYFSRTVARAAREAGIRVLFTSEPVMTVDDRSDCTLVGRFTIRQGDGPEAARRFVEPASWARTGAWLDWNAKGLVKPLLGPSYIRIAGWLHARRAVKPRPTPWVPS
jgi:peptidoglycan/xylan/chitin deacetylase (PgdA/CDA1 family)